MTRLVLIVVALLLVRDAWSQEEGAPPALPPGLTPPEEAQRPAEEPALPEGLEPPTSEEPALPPGLGEEAPDETEDEADGERFVDRLNLHGLWDTRAGIRTQNDPNQSKDFILGESRLQSEFTKLWDRVALDYTGDVILDAALGEADFDLRRLRLSGAVIDSVDVSVGRQVLTWGTGDLVFINDLFPKDWESFLIGRDEEYLKAPSDSVKVSWFSDWMNVDLVYTPQFAPDRFVTGKRLSYWNPLLGRRAGEDHEIDFNAPSEWFTDDEFAWRMYRTFDATEVALYGYVGYWKSPAGQRLIPIQAAFPRLAVYGASVRGTLGPGVANIEIGYYDSRDDRGGDDPFVENSELRLLIGYEQELATDFTGAVQYFVQHMLDYGDYRDTLPFFIESREEARHMFTVRLTKLLMQQNLTLSLFTFYSPSDEDAYLRPSVSYKVTDAWEVSLGGNLFIGSDDHTFFGQFEDNNNLYASMRYSF